MTDKLFLSVDGLTHRYGDRTALDDLSFHVERGTIFGLLGPNGSGKTTLFRILSTLLPLQTGEVRIGGVDLRADLAGVRRLLGVVFQSPSLDKKLTVAENLMHQGHLYGLKGTELRSRIDVVLSQLRIDDRRRDRVETLSGGLQRRVEVAKGLLHQPSLLILDEPTTGLDPGARIELWNHLQEINAEEGTTILVTTHLMDEAERCHQLMILNKGHKVCLDTPQALRASIGGQVITIQAPHPEKIKDALQGIIEDDAEVTVLGGNLRISTKRGGSTGLNRAMEKILHFFKESIPQITLSQPTLEDVFIHHTGLQFETDNSERHA
jgi:ABC-2 type transport system ATP-binding protein